MTATSEEVLRSACWFAGAIYGGVQEASRGRRWLVVTDPETRSTGMIPLDAAFTTSRVVVKVQEIRRRWKEMT